MNVKDYNEKRFDSLLNRTIILSSKKYYKRQMDVLENELLLINKDDDNNYYDIVDDIFLSFADTSNDNIDEVLDIKNAVSKLSAIEQAVIFLAFGTDLTQKNIAKILNTNDRRVRRIEYRALEKMRKILKGDK